MTVVYIDSKNLLNLFEEAVTDLEKGLVTKPYALTQVLDSIGTVTGDPVFFTLPTAIGPFIVEVMQCRQIAASPMLLDETRKRLNKILKECLEEGSKQIKIIGEQVTTNLYDSKALLEEVGTINKQTSIVAHERQALIPRKLPKMELEEDWSRAFEMTPLLTSSPCLLKTHV